ncbi:hypothetical protein G3O08_09235 [Cryomorpha ignava]|uniref:Uncharacterized protein n=1 Tax=Cryomorpha ignava TaxID=101383 RepID=A0A7K3WPU9_9FLAO|nr:hypothetical protein [Cryomorpha ignava]NEN23683.1 hypothetical protein [Cryomorpha ignava]
MSRPLNLNSQGEVVNLKEGRYGVYILGGFGISLGHFSISLKHIGKNEEIKSVKAFWPVQTFVNGERAKKIFIINVIKSGQYEVIFHNPKTVEVKSSNLLTSSFFNSPLLNDNLEVIFTKKLVPFGFVK